MAKRVFEIQRNEKFQAGMSTCLDIQLDDTGRGKAIVEWKHGEKKEFPVRKGQRLFINMWGGFPDVQVWEQPKPPKDPIMKFLWEHGFPKKKVLPWNDPRFVLLKRSEWNSHEVEWLYTEEFGAIKVLFRQIEWESSMTGNWRIGAINKLAIAVRPGATLGEVQEDWKKLKKFMDEIAIIPSPSWGI